MSLVAPIEDGKVVTTTSSESLSNSTTTRSNNSVVSSDTFLTMLVAEMQNQDPLEPTSNTEWVSQYATFTQVEKMDEMGDSMDLMRANALVGQNVIMKVTSSTTGDTTYVKGLVDFVVYENGKAYLYINDQPYALSDLDTVATPEYTQAYDLATEFNAKLSQLPSISTITTTYQTVVQELLDTYNGMTDYQKEFISADYVTALNNYKTVLEDMGVTFNTTTSETTTTTMDDLLAAFNTKMDAILTGISNVSSASSDSSSDTTNTDSITNTGDTTGTDGVENVDGTDDETDGDAIEETESSGEETQESAENSSSEGESKDTDESDSVA